MDGAAAVAETTYIPFRSEPDAAPVRLIVRRVKPTPGSQLALFVNYSYHGFITDRDGDALELDNLARWTARIGLGQQIVTTKTLRRRFFSMAGRLTRSARRRTLHLPQRWPWEAQFSGALARFRALPLPS